MDKLELFETGQVFGFPVDVPLVMQHLQQDMRDDWYSDTLGYADLFKDQEFAIDTLLNCLGSGGGLYFGEKRVLRPIPKTGFAERYSLETDFFDRFVYQAICSFLMPRIDPLLSHRVLSYRYNREASDPKYLFKHKIGKWVDFEGLTYRFLEDGTYLASTDIGNFFENISTSQLIKCLTKLVERCDCDGFEKGQIRAALRVLGDLLRTGTFSGEFGLPQNRDCSSFLSNALLSSVDFKMVELGYDYYRYVDDIRIICKSEHDARLALKATIGLLRDLGMNINSSKTQVLSKESDDEEIQKLFPSQSPLILAIENMWRSKSRRVFIKSIEYILSVVQKAFDDGDTQSRSFRFAVNRLSKLIQAGLFDIDSDDARNLMQYALEALYNDPVSTDRICQLLIILKPTDEDLEKICEFLTDRNQCIHEWQNHHLWVLLASFRYDHAKLKELGKNLVLQDATTGEAAGIFIWMQAVGYLQPIKDLLDSYCDDWPFQNQRFYLFAAAGLTSEEQNKLRGRVSPKLARTCSRAKSAFRDDGVAIRELERPSFEELYNDIKDYS